MFGRPELDPSELGRPVLGRLEGAERADGADLGEVEGREMLERPAAGDLEGEGREIDGRLLDERPPPLEGRDMEGPPPPREGRDMEGRPPPPPRAEPPPPPRAPPRSPPPRPWAMSDAGNIKTATSSPISQYFLWCLIESNP